MNVELRHALDHTGWFSRPGIYSLFDGQFGSTGKGLMAGAIAEAMNGRINVCVTNAGPNSGHTAYLKMGAVEHKIITRQLPVAAVVSNYLDDDPVEVVLNGGAIIDTSILRQEILDYGLVSSRVRVHPNAVRILPEDFESKNTNIASTAKGVGPAMIRKLKRESRDITMGAYQPLIAVWELERRSFKQGDVAFMEIAQGFSLGINSGMYPYVTSRECTPAQGMADWGAPLRAHRKSIVCLRTFPIRVGNVEGGSSGPCYPDQKETTFAEIGQEVELTTVTKRPRRIFTWSWRQYEDMLEATAPDAIFLNFCNYMPVKALNSHLAIMRSRYEDVLRRKPDFIALGFGPRDSDMVIT